MLVCDFFATPLLKDPIEIGIRFLRVLNIFPRSFWSFFGNLDRIEAHFRDKKKKFLVF